MRHPLVLGLIALCTAAACFFAPAQAQTQNYPSRPVTLIVPYPAAGATDIVARLLAEHLKSAWKQPVLIDNRPGANAMVGVLAVARAAPDGHTLLLTGSSLSSYKALLKNPQVDPERELAPISLVFVVPVVLVVSAQTPIASLSEFISYARARLGKLNYATLGGGNLLTAETFNQLAGINGTRVAYKGEPLAALALSRDEVQFAFLSPNAVRTLVQTGKVRALALSTAGARSRVLPDVPTSMEAGLKGLDQAAWFGVLAPANTPDEIRRKVARDIGVFVSQPEVQARLTQLGIDPVSNSPEEFSKMITVETDKYGQVARNAGLEPE